MLSAVDNTERPWDAIVAGAAIPGLMLTIELIVILTGNSFGTRTWVSTSWLVASLIAFASRYASRNVASAVQELHFGLWLGGAPTLLLALVLRPQERYGWLGMLIIAFGFVYNLVRYIRLFYFEV
jgi:hypothetical protein